VELFGDTVYEQCGRLWLRGYVVKRSISCDVGVAHTHN